MFWILHLIALFVFPVALFVTIPLHIIASNVSKKQTVIIHKEPIEKEE